MNQREIVENMFNTACVVVKKSPDHKFDTIESMPSELKSLLYTQIVNATQLPRTTVRRIVNQYMKRENVTEIVNELAENMK
mgnify:CR=1 FL=1